MFQGLSGKSIAFNEHGIAPRDTALGKREGADAERKRNARAAKRARKTKAAAYRGVPCTRAPKRERTVLRVLGRKIRAALRNGDRATFEPLALQYELLMAQRSKRAAARQ